MVKSIRTLVMTRDSPYPPMGGAPLRNWQNINIMREFGEVAIFSVSNSSHIITENTSLPIDINLWSRHYIDDIYTPNNTIEKLQGLLNCDQHYSVNSLYSDSIAAHLETVLIEFKPDLVIFEEPWLYKYLFVVKKYNKCAIILDAHNVEAPLYKQNSHKKGDLKSKVQLHIDTHKIKSIEYNFIKQVNQIWMCSDADINLLNHTYGKNFPAIVIPNGVDVSHYNYVCSGELTSSLDLKSTPQTLLFNATFSYTPNQVAAHLLIEQIFPKLQIIYPECRLILAGKSPTSAMLESAKNNPAIIVTGAVPDMRIYLATTNIVIVPLLQGGGTRLKILEAFSSGKVVISTAKGAEGLIAKDGEHLLIRNTVDEMVKGICEVWQNPDLQRQLTQNAYELVKANYSWQSVEKKVENSIVGLFIS